LQEVFGVRVQEIMTTDVVTTKPVTPDDELVERLVGHGVSRAVR